MSTTVQTTHTVSVTQSIDYSHNIDNDIITKEVYIICMYIVVRTSVCNSMVIASL